MRQVWSLTRVLLLFAGGAQARPMQVLQTTPAGNATIESLNTEFAVRFDGNVDHQASRLYVTHGGKVVEELHPLLSAAPEVLFARSPRLPAGSYELHWDGRFLPDGDITSGSLPFRVR
jgi:methionine-rich copper-binding protein CopC